MMTHCQGQRRIDLFGLHMQNGSSTRVKEALHDQSFLRELQETESGMQLYVERGEEVLLEVLRLLDNNGAPSVPSPWRVQRWKTYSCA